MSIDIQLRAEHPIDLTADLLVVGVFQTAAKAAVLPTALKPIDAALSGALARQMAKEEFIGKRDQALSLTTLGRIGAPKLVVFGLGERRTVRAPQVRTFAAKAARAANSEKAATLAVALPSGLETEMRAVAEGIVLGAYRFTKYLTADRKPKSELTTALVASP